MENAPAGRVGIWDLAVRICHWSFALLIPTMWWTAENGEMGWHMRLGILLLALLVFRVLWGFFGSSTARFSHFVRGPGAVIAYFKSLSQSHDPVIGHNPAGGWSVLALLGAMIFQVVLGLFSGDPFDGATGPLNDLVGVMTADTMTDLHESFFNVLIALVALHIAAIAFYLVVKRDNLVHPMVSGKRSVPAGLKGNAPVPAWRGIVCAVVAMAVAYWVWSGAPPL
ncbi:cytochrome b/b6 domain-containing protein [Croceicoccus mobilis]|uniref:Cytochrome b561 n=1 Tax=Croceicoccus mobilis TaxID=1703339 RepID=A0A916YVB1_9SPHN|nr:cytochrome b/b6 domain-containing protein [Croceicoccus mobilis]GGD62724.1 cytochrome b561 [Croceicoccus mobilis]